MKYFEFIDEMAKRVKMCFDKEVSVEVHKVVKNNSMEYDSLIINEPGRNVTPNFYLQGMYSRYVDGIGLDSLVSEIVQKYESAYDSEKYENLCESYVIFITENDIMKVGVPIYHIDRTVKETGELFSDESYIIYVNSQIKDESALGKLMHDFSCTDAKDMKYKILADRVRYFKEDEKGVATMCKAMEEMRNEAVKEERIEVARQLLELGKLSYEEIAKIAKMTIEEVKALDKKVSA